MHEVIPNNLLLKIHEGENTSVEFKRAEQDLPRTLFETICGMLNSGGGDIFLGVEDDGTISGIPQTSADRFKKDFANLCNNPQKIYPTIRADIKEYYYNNKIILYVYVYESSDVHKTAGKIFIRTEDGDRNITDNTHLVSQLYINKSNTYIENKIFPFATIDDLRPDLIERARKLAVNHFPGHPWKDMDDEELLRSAMLYERNLQTGEEGINLAGILLLGKDETIASAIPYYRTDALLRVQDTDRYDDRDDIRTNLIDACDRLVDFVKKHTDDKFYLNEQGQRLDIRSIIARELCANMLIHREYSNPTVAQLIITKEAIHTTNANKPRFIGYIDVASYAPFPKNPKIAKFFKEIGYADELGSGFKKIEKYTKIYSDSKPIFKEGETFDVTVPLGQSAAKRSGVSPLRVAILDYIGSHDGVTRREINTFAYPLLDNIPDTQKDSKIHNIIAEVSKRKIIQNKGSRARPLWVLVEHSKKHAKNTQRNTQNYKKGV